MFYKNKKSFGLLEVVIVVAIFFMTLAGIISITGLAYKNLVKNEIRWKAAMIGQNIIEEKRNKRDTNLLSGQPWNAGLSHAGHRDYDIDMNTPPVSRAVFRASFSSVPVPAPPAIPHTYSVEVTVLEAGTSINFGTFLKSLTYY